MSSKTRVPTSDSVVQWSRSTGASNYALIDEYPATDDTDYNFTVDPSLIDKFGYSAFDVPPGSVITNVKVYVRGKSSYSGATIAGSIWVGGQIYSGTPTNFTTSFTEVAFTWTTNPATSLPWTLAVINDIVNGLQCLGYVEEGIPETTTAVSRLYMEVNYTNIPSSFFQLF